MTTTPDPLMIRAKALKLHGLLAHWETVATADWVAPLITWEEDERARRGLERRLGNAHLGRFKPLAGFDWQWPTQCDRAAIDDLMDLHFLTETANVVLLQSPRRGRGCVRVTLSILLEIWKAISPSPPSPPWPRTVA